MKKFFTSLFTLMALATFAQFQAPKLEIGLGLGANHPEVGAFGKMNIAANELFGGLGFYVSPEFKPNVYFSEDDTDYYFRIPVGLTFRTNTPISLHAGLDPFTAYKDASGQLHMRKELGIRYHLGPWVLQTSYGFYAGSTFGVGYQFNTEGSPDPYTSKRENRRMLDREALQPRVDTVTITDTIIVERVVIKEVVKVVEKEPTMTLIATVRFEFNSTAYTASSRGLIEDVVNTVKADPNRQIVLIGHTDEAGSENFNYNLGMERAQRIANELAITYGIPSGQIDVRSEGKTNPVSDDDKSKNRRVGVYLK